MLLRALLLRRERVQVNSDDILQLENNACIDTE
jgi:hypothetical protein